MTKRSTLALVTTSFPIAGDGSEAAGAFVADLVEELAESIDVRVIAPGLCEERQPLGTGIEIFRFRAPDAPLSTLKPWRPKQLSAIFSVLRSGQRAIDEAVRDGNVEHILALWALPSGHWARRAAASTEIPYSVWTLGSDIWSLGRIPVLRGYLRRILNDARHCYSDGLKLARDTEALAGRPVEFLPSTRKLNTVRAAPVRSLPPYRLVFLGRWHPNKGIDLLLDALGLLTDEDWQRIQSVRIFGGGPMEPDVRRGVQALLQSGKPVQLGSYLSKQIAEAEISGADYLLIPSRIESVPVIFSDAIKLQTPVISTPVGDLPQLVDANPQCGILAAAVGAADLAQAIRGALKTPPANFNTGLTKMGERFDLSSIASSLANDLCLKSLGEAR